MALDALAEALADAIAALPSVPAGARTAVAMSGGVDSAVALQRIVDRGDAAVGITLRLWIDPDAPDAARACCSPDAVRRARATCHALGVPHITLDARDGFREIVVAPFLDDYQAGRTPNPCTTCNGDFRIALLADTARRLGPIGSRRPLRASRAAPRRWRSLAPWGRSRQGPVRDARTRGGRAAGMLEFPLAGAHKQDVRREAVSAGLAAATAPESQDVCFLGGGELRGFLDRHGVDLRPGEIRAPDGAVLGRHRGAVAFTSASAAASASPPPSRSTCRRSTPRPASSRSRRSAALARREVELIDATLHRPVSRVHARLRVHMADVGATVETLTEGIRLHLDEPVFAVAPGQVAVLYDDDGVVVGAGTIAAARATVPA